MKITWIDKKSVLRGDKKFYKAGDEIPAGSLSPARIELLKSQKKIRVGDEVKKNVVQSDVMGIPVEAEIMPAKREDPTEAAPVKPSRGRKAKDDNSSEG